MTFSLDLMGYIIADYGLDLSVLKSSLGKPRQWVPEKNETLQVLLQWLEVGAGIRGITSRGNEEQGGTLTG